ncbi:MAG: hypothetical protein HDQ88_12345 [Clostridia bacterium]|nr:hypothetical protein [Clostridia bacterium]
MKTDIDIKDDIYSHIKGSGLAMMVSGQLSKTLRPDKSTAEDIVISMLANVNRQIQEAFVNINIYVADLQKGTQFVENTIRLRELCTASSELLEVGRGEGYRFSLDEQRVLEVPGSNEHVINNKLLYKFAKS